MLSCFQGIYTIVQYSCINPGDLKIYLKTKYSAILQFTKKQPVWQNDPDTHHSGKLDPDPDPDPHRSEKMEALEGHFRALKGPNLERSEW